MSKGGIADRMIAFNGFPFLDNKEDHSFGVPVSQAMTNNPTCFPASGLEFEDVQRILSDNKFQGYPIVDDLSTRTLLGYIGRTELLYAINRVQRDQKIARKAKIFFLPSNSRNMASPALGRGPAVTFDTMPATAGQTSVDFSRFIDATPLSVHPRLPLETVMELFKKMGPRVILIEYRGKLTGLVTVKDCLKYQFKVEAQENPKDDTALEDSQERLWELFSRVGSWFGRRRPTWAGGALRLGEDELNSHEQEHEPEDAGVSTLLGHERTGSQGSEDTDLELENR
jgi:chloride channel 3/4/5